METISARIKRLRTGKGWSRPELGRRMAKAIGRGKPFSGESIRRYEKGIDVPRRDGRAGLAAVFEKDEAYIMFGESGTKAEAQQPTARYAADLAPDVERLIRAYTWLMDEERDDLLKDLEAKAETNKAIAKQLGPRFKITSAERVLDVLKRGGDFPPGRRKKAAGSHQARRAQKFKEEDPE